MKKKVFLGGTCNESDWRDKLIAKLHSVDYFNPVVPNWTPECMEEELRQREICDFCLYVITPKMTGTYSIAEVVDDSNKRPDKTLFCYLENDFEFETRTLYKFNEGQLKSLSRVANMVKENGARVFNSLDEIAEYLNNI